MSDLPAGRVLDVAIATKVFGLTVVALDWPCGYLPDGCRLEASMYAEGDSLYTERHPVYVPDGGTWPPAVPDFMRHHFWPDDYAEAGWDRPQASVEPVPFYSTDISAAWAVWEWLTTQQPDHLLTLQYLRGAYAVQVSCGNMMCVVRGSIAPTAPLSICRAALQEASQRE